MQKMVKQSLLAIMEESLFSFPSLSIDVWPCSLPILHLSSRTVEILKLFQNMGLCAHLLVGIYR